MRLALLLAAACSSPQPPAAPPAKRVAPPPVAAPAPPRPVEAPHAGRIRAFAASADGKSAVSIDGSGGARLWPTLDGTREPRVIDLPPATALAIAPRGAGFAVAALDRVGGIFLAQIDESGHTGSHVVLSIEPAPYRGMAMTARGLLAWRADHTLALLGDDGAMLGRLGTEPGQRLATVAIARSRAVAVIESGEPATRRARWVVLEPQLAWGEWIDTGADLGPDVALSPSGARLALVRVVAKVLHIQVIETATGKLVSDGAGGLTPLGFIDEDHVALGGGALSWLDLPTGRIDVVAGAGAPRSSDRAFAVVDGKLVAATPTDLVIATPARLAFLGYAATTPRLARPAGDGGMLVQLGHTYTLLDRHLMVVREPQLVLPEPAIVVDLCRLDGDIWLVAAVRSDDSNQRRLLLADLAHGTATVAMTGGDIVSGLQYEPTTHLAVIPIDRKEIDRYDPTQRTLTRIGKPFEPEDALALTAPALAGGVEVVRTRTVQRTVVDARRDPERTADTPLELDRPVFAVDRAGRTYSWRDDKSPKDGIAVLAGGKQVAVLGGNDRDVPQPFPSPTGEQVVLTTSLGASLYDLTGKQRWHLAVSGISQAVWLDAGEIALSGMAGIAVVDAASGAVTAARCGWRFELATSPHHAPMFSEPLCAQLR